jgi:hypothetical protein
MRVSKVAAVLVCALLLAVGCRKAKAPAGGDGSSLQPAGADELRLVFT